MCAGLTGKLVVMCNERPVELARLYLAVHAMGGPEVRITNLQALHAHAGLFTMNFMHDPCMHTSIRCLWLLAEHKV